MPDDVSVQDMVDYITKAVKCEKGNLMPDEPLALLNTKSVKVTRLYRQRSGRK